MSKIQPKAPDELRIWQQNARRSPVAHNYILNSADPSKFDIILIQEPWIDSYGKSRGNAYFRTIYPSTFYQDGHPPIRSLILINTNILTDCYSSLDIPSSDVTAIQLLTNSGSIALFNIYNDITHNLSTQTIDTFLLRNPSTSSGVNNHHMIWMGDFNRHHPLWEDSRNRNLFNSSRLIDPLLDLIHSYGMQMALPAGIPTLEATSGNWTRPDNVWRSASDTNIFISCNVAPALRPPLADHLPIISVLDISLKRAVAPLSRNFRNVDWDEFRSSLGRSLAPITPHRLHSAADTASAASSLTQAIQDTICAIIPPSKPSPFAKRWWTKDLSKMRKEKNRLSSLAFKFRHIPNHPSKKQYRQFANKYANEIRKVKTEHWEEWLENITDKEVFAANKIVTDLPSDYARARIPPLKTSLPDGSPSLASSNQAKAAALARTFFPPPPATPSIPPNPIYPKPLKAPKFFTKAQIKQKIRSLAPYKAPGPDGIPNIVLVRCADLLADHLFFLYRGLLEHDAYFNGWLHSTTVVLQKPGKTTYDVPKAYRPVGLLDTLGKLFSALVAEDLTHLCDAHHLLPRHQFGGRPGRTTTDAIHLVVDRVKQAWRAKKTAALLFLDVQSAFPNTVKEVLLHNMKLRKVPSSYVKLAERLLTNRTTTLVFDDYSSDPFPLINGTTQGCCLSMLFYAFYNAPLFDLPLTSSQIPSGFVDNAAYLGIGDSIAEAHRAIRDMMERPNGAFDWSHSHNSPFELSKLILINFPRPNSVDPEAGLSLSLSKPNPHALPTLQTVQPSPSHRYLGVIIDSKLNWAPHHSKVVATAVTWTNQFARLGRLMSGIPPKKLR